MSGTAFTDDLTVPYTGNGTTTISTPQGDFESGETVQVGFVDCPSGTFSEVGTYTVQ